MTTSIRHWWGCGGKGTLIYCWCECKLVQRLWKTVWRILKKLKIELSYDSAISILGIYLKTHWKRLWCWEGLGAGEEGDDRGWDDWMASLTRWMRVWVNSGSWWWTGRPGMLRFMWLQSWTQLSDWTELNSQQRIHGFSMSESLPERKRNLSFCQAMLL